MIVEIKKFSIGAGTIAVLMPKRLCLVVSSRSVRRQPEKLGRRRLKVWNKVLPGDRCWQSGVLVDQVCQQHEWVVPGIAARYREGLCRLAQYRLCMRMISPVQSHDPWRQCRSLLRWEGFVEKIIMFWAWSETVKE